MADDSVEGGELASVGLPVTLRLRWSVVRMNGQQWPCGVCPKAHGRAHFFLTWPREPSWLTSDPHPPLLHSPAG